MTHRIRAQLEGPDLLAVDDHGMGNLKSQVGLDRRCLTGFVTQQAVEDHVDDGSVVAGRRPMRVSGAEVGGVDAEPQDAGLGHRFGRRRAQA